MEWLVGEGRRWGGGVGWQDGWGRQRAAPGLPRSTLSCTIRGGGLRDGVGGGEVRALPRPPSVGGGGT